RRVQSSTLLGAGSPEATPSVNRSRRSVQRVVEARAAPCGHAKAAPRAAAVLRNSRRDCMADLCPDRRGIVLGSGPRKKEFSMRSIVRAAIVILAGTSP